MLVKRIAPVFFGFLVVLALLVPAITANHLEGDSHLWNDAGLNTRLGQAATIGWNDAGFNTRLVQNVTTGWNDLGIAVRRVENHVAGWNDVGTGAGLL